jgi:hypothetical protein
MRFAVEEISLEQGFGLIFFGFPLRINIPPLFHTHLSPSPEVYDIPEQAAQYHFLGLHVTGHRVRRLVFLYRKRV